LRERLKMTTEESRPTVLVVDDTEANLDLLTGVLSRYYEVIAATDGESALESVREQKPDLILLDIMMPGMDGYEVCRRLKGDPVYAKIPVIFLTALTEIENKTKGFQMGAVDYITKPFEVVEVQARVATHLMLHQQNRKLAKQNRLLKDYARMRDEVERMTRHDLKSPLNAVITVPAMLLEEANLTPDERELLQMLQESGYRMLQIINSSLDMYKMEIGRYQYNPEPVDVIRVVNQIRGEARELMNQKGIDIFFMMGAKPARTGDALWVSGEEMLLYTMLANLIKNAVEASPEGESITISMDQGDMAVVRIHNQGEVPREIKDKFFQKYATAGKKGGTGLGTYIAKLITKTLGGEISMNSSAAEGTLITVKLPPSATAGKVEDPTVIESSPKPSAPKASLMEKGLGSEAVSAAKEGHKPAARFLPDIKTNILVVDDYSNMRRITKSTLRRMGYTNILEADNGEVALRLAMSKKIDLIISDVNMPKMNGIELLQAVRSEPRIADLPFIVITGEADKEIILAAAKAKVSEYILKPYSPDILEAKINKVMNKASAS